MNSNDEYYVNDNYSDNNNNYYNDKSYEEPEKKKSILWKILIGVLVVLIIFIIIKVVGSSKTGDEKYTELKTKLCSAAEIYVEDNNGIIDNTKAGTSANIKLKKLTDANLIETQIINPYYNSSLFKTSDVDKFYSLDNSVRLTVLTDGTYNCEIINNSDDVTAPVLRLSGDAEITIAIGTEFEDPGYTATDDYDGDITANVVRSGNVDTNTAGDYTITYTITDTAGNVSTMTRKIIVEEYSDIAITPETLFDNTTPMISLKGSNPYCMVKGTQYVEPGAIASDNVDGDITNSISITNKVTGNLLGSFRVMYEVADSSGNEAIAYRSVIVTTECPNDVSEDLVANTAPVITLIGKTAVTIQKGTQYIDLGATAYDKEDGDVTSQITTDTTGVDIYSAGVYKVTYRVTDSNGETSSAVRTVTIKDTVAAKTTVKWATKKSNITVIVGEGKDSLLSAPKAVDESGTSLTVTTKIEDYVTKVNVTSIDWSSVGKYKVTYTAVHGNGTLKQTKSIVVNITTDGVSIGGSSQISITKRNSNCDITESDLTSGGVTFSTNKTGSPLISLSTTDRAACFLGTYDVVVSARMVDTEAVTKTIKVNVVNGTVQAQIDTTSPSKVVLKYNSAFSNDLYNKLGKWVGGSTTGITLTFNSTPAKNTEISYYEWSIDCNEVGGQASKVGTNEGSMTWTNEGKNSVCIRAVTTTGSKGLWSDPINLYVDRSGPTIEFTEATKTLGIGQNDWHNTSTITIGYTAGGESGESGLDHFEYTYDDVKGLYGEKITNPTTYNEASGNLVIGENIESNRPSLFVYVRAVDKVGNAGEWTANPAFANIDTVKPNAPTVEVLNDSTSSVKLLATFSDGTSLRQSGFGKMIYIVNSGSELTETSFDKTTSKSTITVPSNKTSSNVIDNIKVWSVDKAGNRSDLYAEKNVTVTPAKVVATSVKLTNNGTTIENASSCSTSSIYVGSTISLTATPLPTNSEEKVVYWSSSNAEVATINENGVVTIKKLGSAIITAKIGSVSTICKVDSSTISTNSSMTVKNYDGINYYLYIPENLTPNSSIIVFLHGSGEIGSNIELVKKWGLPKAINEGNKFNAIIISPQCPSGNRWTTRSLQDKVIAIINKTITDYNANASKVSITGFSIGGTGVYSFIENNSKVFSSGVPVSAATSAVATSRFPSVPIWIFAGGKEGTLSSYAKSIYSSFLRYRTTDTVHLNVISGKDHTGMVGNNGYNVYTDSTYNIVNWMINQSR